MAKIVFRTGAKIGQQVTVPETGITLGRGSSASVVVDDALMSGKHLEIKRVDGSWWAFDLDSSNGTRFKGADIKSLELSGGEELELGDTRIVFDSEVPNSATAKVPAARPLPRSAAPAPSPAISEDDAAVIREVHDTYKRMKKELANVIVGQAGVIDEVLMAVFSRGHALLVGVPGLAKTLLISTLSRVLELSFKRIQFTPDLMPSDITGSDVLEEDKTTGERIFRFVNGPLFANMVLADEINRTPPKTQAALLEAMQEHSVTVGSQTYRLPEPFFVLATQNPIEQEGTYQLPEAQLDRFMFNIIVDYPDSTEESQIIRQVTGMQDIKVTTQLNAEQVLRLQQVIRRVPVADHVIDFARNLARATRPKQPEAPDIVREMVNWGAGPRAGIYLITAAKARAVLEGRYHATTSDVAAVALPVLRHRVITTFNAEAAGVTSDQIIKVLLDQFRPSDNIDI